MEEKKERLSEIMAKYLAGEASSEETADLIAWLEADRRHAREFSRLVDFDRAACPPFDPAGIREEPARERVLAHVRRDECRIRRMRFIRGLERIAAVLFLPAVLVSAALLLGRSASDPAAETWQTVTTPFRTHSQLELPDGSKVWLNGGSTLRYPLAFKPGERAVSLTGEAYFEAENPKGALGFFIISNGGGVPYRVKIRAPSFVSLCAMQELIPGHHISDVPIILGSMDFVLGECDR